MMNFIELTGMVFTVVSLISGIPALATTPCTKKNCEARYQQFLNRHVLQANFDRSSPQQWESYLQARQLWDRAPTQSFVEPSQNVEDICTNGFRVLNGGNLCISRSKMQVYDVVTWKDNNNVSRITPLEPRSTRVIVACDKVNNRCLPVHWQKYTGQKQTYVRC